VKLRIMEKIFCIFGDSITYGAWDFDEGGWVNRFRKFLDKKNLVSTKNYFLVYNLGVDGDGTADLLKMIDEESRSRFRGTVAESRAIIFAIGTNDSCYQRTKSNAVVMLNLFENNLSEIIKKARNFTSQIIFVGIAKGSDKDTVPLKSSTTGKCYDKENIIIYNNIIKKICEKEKVLFIDILNNMTDEDFYDGLHPNARGHQKIFKIVKDFLIDRKII